MAGEIPLSDEKKAIDWQEVHRRLDNAGQELEQGFQPTLARKKEKLRERAQELAREPAGRNEAGAGIEVVEFVLAHERYAVESSYVREVYPLRDITPLPGTPPFVAGIVNVRGRILSVIDIRKFFDLPEKGLGELNRIIILASEEMEFGILADAVIGNRRLGPGELEPSLPTLAGIREEYLKGVTGERLVVLDGARILSDQKIIVDDRGNQNTKIKY